MTSMKSVTDASFTADVIGSKGLTLVDFWAPWCGPCRALEPVLEQIAEDYAGRVQVLKLDVDENPSTAAHFQIRSIPSLILFENGTPVEGMVGTVPRTQLTRLIDSRLGAGVAR
jgi:thioredoxin 1